MFLMHGNELAYWTPQVVVAGVKRCEETRWKVCVGRTTINFCLFRRWVKKSFENNFENFIKWIFQFYSSSPSWSFVMFGLENGPIKVIIFLIGQNIFLFLSVSLSLPFIFTLFHLIAHLFHCLILISLSITNSFSFFPSVHLNVI